MAKYKVVRRGRRVIGRWEKDRTFHIAWSKSNIKAGKVQIPQDIFDMEITGKAEILTLTNDDIRYWLSVHEFLAYATKIRKEYVVPLYNFKSRKI